MTEQDKIMLKALSEIYSLIGYASSVTAAGESIPKKWGDNLLDYTKRAEKAANTISDQITKGY